MADLEAIARRIPSMGGATIGPFLRLMARHAEPGTSIVEVGSWLGAGTAHLALGVRDRSDSTVDIHCFDGWSATKSECQEALSQTGIVLEPFEDTLPRVQATLSAFQVPIHYHKGNVSNAKWEGRKISVYVDDASKGSKAFLHVLKTFGPYWVPGKTVVVLMDYYYWKKLKGFRAAEYRCQQSFIERHSDHFTLIKDFRERFQVPFSNEAFRYEKTLDFETLRVEPTPVSIRRLIPAPISAMTQRVLSRIGFDV
jgi:hypothetical protein